MYIQTYINILHPGVHTCVCTYVYITKAYICGHMCVCMCINTHYTNIYVWIHACMYICCMIAYI